jgi:hypothetical protein
MVLVMLDFQIVLLEGGKFLGAFAKLRKAAVSFVMSAWNNFAPTGRGFHEI